MNTAVVWAGTVACLLVFQFQRGFGWDGDSFISAAQLIKLLNPDIYGSVDSGAQPKLLSILVFGSFYLIFGSFHALSIAAILLNAWMVVLLCAWTRDEGGSWFVAWLLLVANVGWNTIVASADNPGFSVPFLVLGLYVFCHQRRQEAGAFLLMISSFFRPGAEIVLGVLLLRELIKGNRNVITCGAFLFLASVHTLYGSYLAYPSKELYLRQTVYADYTGDPLSHQMISHYKGSFHVLGPYFRAYHGAVRETASILLILPALLGLAEIIRKRSSLRCLVLVPLASLIYPVGAFWYGVSYVFASKVLEITLILPVFAAFCDFRAFAAIVGRRKRAASVVACLALLTWLWYEGGLLRGHYETNADGLGLINWRSLKGLAEVVHRAGLQGKFSVTVDVPDLTFMVLDNGFHLKNLSLLVPVGAAQRNWGDVILIRKEKAEALSSDLARTEYMKVDFPPDYLLYIRRSQATTKPSSVPTPSL